MTSLRIKEIYLPELVGKGYGTFWNFKGRYKVVKGSRASKKSTTAAMSLINNIMAYPGSNGLVVRKVFRTIKDSCFAQLRWAINRLGVNSKWKATLNPLELTYKPTGQKILFRGLDDPLKVTSVTVDTGHLCFLWIEEAYEITKEEDFNMLDESIRGEVPDGLFKQITVTFNPWNERHWLKKRFFDIEDDDIFTSTTNYMINEWLDEADRRMFERMKEQNPKRYQVAGLGDWGIVEGLIFENWKEEHFDHTKMEGIYVNGLDFGFTNDPTAIFRGKINTNTKTLYVYDEIYKKQLSNEKIAEEIIRRDMEHEIIIADSAEPKSVARLKTLGVHRVRSAKKGKDSVNAGIDFLQDYVIIIHPRCVNFLTEISNYTWDENREGTRLNVPTDDMNHLMDAMRYAVEPYMIEQRMKTVSKRTIKI